MRQADLFATPKMQMNESLDLMAWNLATYGSRYDHWVVAYSGGKDSSATVTITLWLVGLAWQLQDGQDPGYEVSDEVRQALLELTLPRSITVLYADTRAELPPLHLAAMGLGEEIDALGQEWREEGHPTRLAFQVVRAPLDKRFLVYVLGRGVPPPNNNTMRWCTRQIKIDPMARAIEQIAIGLGYGRMSPRKRGQVSDHQEQLAAALSEADGPFETDEAQAEIYRGFDQDLLEEDPIWSNYSAQAAQYRRLLGRTFTPKRPRGLPKGESIPSDEITFQRRMHEGEQAVARAQLPACELAIKNREKELLPRPRKLLVLTGVRRGESAIREARIVASCTTDKAECGQGWFQRDLPWAVSDTYAPLDHFRICHVWQWLWTWAPQWQYGGWSTWLIAEAYGGRDGDEAAEVGARTGCNGCPLATDEQAAMRRVVAMPAWAYLAPLLGLWALYWSMREPQHRLRKADREALKGGGWAKNAQRMGPLTLEARWHFLTVILGMQEEINKAAQSQGRPLIDLLDAEEEARIRELIASRVWPDGWSGDEPRADVLLPAVYADGSVQPLLFEL